LICSGISGKGAGRKFGLRTGKDVLDFQIASPISFRNPHFLPAPLPLMQNPKLRPNVAAIVRRPDGRILVGERSDWPGYWQFPQGGIHVSETPEQALQRELQEEISLPPDSYRVTERRGPYRYLFMTGRKKQGFDGQEQIYFLIDLLPAHSEPSPHTADPEFRAIRWIWPHELEISRIPGFKREVYRQIMSDFFQVSL
jgi:NTP pyrophosphohydrolases including oxidative damage repair enzymes